MRDITATDREDPSGMEITKRLIGESQEQAEDSSGGDLEGQDVLRNVGLWKSDEEFHVSEAEYRFSIDSLSSNEPIRFFAITEAS